MRVLSLPASRTFCGFRESKMPGAFTSSLLALPENLGPDV